MKPDSLKRLAAASCWDDAVVGNHTPVHLLDGAVVPFVGLDCASTAPALRHVVHTVEELLPQYGSVGRGGGRKSELCTLAYEEARRRIMRFVGADSDRHVGVFVKQTTDAINQLASQLPLTGGDVVLCTLAEHHANMLPWMRAAKRSGAEFILVGVEPSSGEILVDSMLEQIERYKGRVKLVAMSGASNVTGHIPDWRHIAKAVHAQGGALLIDGAQLAPHRSVDVRDPRDDECIDFFALSGHKMYAPFGSGLLVASRRLLESCEPAQVGGGAAAWVELERVLWRDLPYRNEAGSPNLIGAVAMAAATDALSTVGMDRIRNHEIDLTRYTLRRLREVEGLAILGPADDRCENRLGVFTFTIPGIDHKLVSAILNYEHGIATRSGAFCAHPYVVELMRSQGEAGRSNAHPGAVRASLGLYSVREDIDRLVDGLKAIAAGQYADTYAADERADAYAPTDWEYELSDALPPQWIRRNAKRELLV